MPTFKSLKDMGVHLLDLPDGQSTIDSHIYKSDLDRLSGYGAGRKPAGAGYGGLIEEIQGRKYPNNSPFHEFRGRLDDHTNDLLDTKDVDSWAKNLDARYKKTYFNHMQPGEFFSSGLHSLCHTVIGEQRPSYEDEDKMIEAFNAFVIVSHEVYGVLIKQGYELNQLSRNELIEIFSEQYTSTLSGVYSQEVDWENTSQAEETRFGQFDKAMKERIKKILLNRVIPNEE